MRMSLIFLTVLSVSPVIAQEGYPEVSFAYSYTPFDRECSNLADFEIKPEWIAEIEARLDSFQVYWDSEGRALLQTTISKIGKPFVQQEMIATITLCKFRSMSLPLILNLRRFLKSATDNQPRPKFMFLALVFHELLHTYVHDILEGTGSSSLLEKYESESGSVKSHLHLLAVMKMVYLELSRNEELEHIIEQNSNIGPVYARAWEIVNDIERHEAFVNELKVPAQNPR